MSILYTFVLLWSTLFCMDIYTKRKTEISKNHISFTLILFSSYVIISQVRPGPGTVASPYLPTPHPRRQVGFPGISEDSIRIKVNAVIDNLKPDAEGYVDMEQIIYHVLRCGLVHSCNLDRSIEFTERTIIGDWNADKFYIPKAIIWGLIAAVENGNK